MEFKAKPLESDKSGLMVETKLFSGITKVLDSAPESKSDPGKVDGISSSVKPLFGFNKSGLMVKPKLFPGIPNVLDSGAESKSNYGKVDKLSSLGEDDLDDQDNEEPSAQQQLWKLNPFKIDLDCVREIANRNKLKSKSESDLTDMAKWGVALLPSFDIENLGSRVLSVVQQCHEVKAATPTVDKGVPMAIQ